jgi:hypothetical protein
MIRMGLYMEVIKLHTCKQCGKNWFPRTPGTPRICPTCKSTYWNIPKKNSVKAILATTCPACGQPVESLKENKQK